MRFDRRRPRDLGLIHVKLQTWFPFRIQVYVNGHEWLARRLDHHDVKFIKVDNAFLHLGDVKRAQELAALGRPLAPPMLEASGTSHAHLPRSSPAGSVSVPGRRASISWTRAAVTSLGPLVGAGRRACSRLYSVGQRSGTRRTGAHAGAGDS